MTLLEFLVPIGALDSIAGVLPYVVMLLVVATFLTRHRAHETHKSAVDDGAESLEPYTPHVVVSALLVAASFLYMIVHPHGGMVISVLTLGMVVSDFFEFEARQVEARNGMELEAPKSAIVASVVALLYALYQALFWVIKGPWSAVI